MPLARRIVTNLYRDSVSLMQLSARISASAGVTRAFAVMGTQANLSLLAEAGLADGAGAPQPSDIVLVVEGVDDASVATALAAADAELNRPVAVMAAPAGAIAPTSIAMALEDLPGANLALIATPGEYAAAEAMKALRLGLNVMLFSSNVDVADEIALKAWGRDHGLMVMGPDCGTAVLHGIPLGFANVLRAGPIGLVAASGTGLQQVTCLIDRGGLGISHAIGTGGRDLSREVGGIAMLQGIAALAADPATRVIVLISKPPAREIARKVREAAEQAGKPVVVNFLGAEAEPSGRNVHMADTLEDAANAALALAGGAPAPPSPVAALVEAASHEAAQLTAGQRYVRGLYSGGTLCYEALLLLGRDIGPVWSNTPLDPACALPDVGRSRHHTAIDLGDERLTRGRPHPMIDPRLRHARIVQEAADHETAVVLLDVVLGHGAHADPAGAVAAAIAEARGALAAGRHVAFVASVCGTTGDPQDLRRQETTLREAGVLLALSNAAAARLAARIALGVRSP